MRTLALVSLVIVVLGTACADPTQVNSMADAATDAPDDAAGSDRTLSDHLDGARTDATEDASSDAEGDLPLTPDTPDPPDTQPDTSDPDTTSEPIDCAAVTAAGWTVCAESDTQCAALFEDGAGCTAVCASAGLPCLAVFENQDGACAADHTRPPLTCDPPSGHQSDYCVCGTGDLPPPPEPPEALCDDTCPAFPGAEGEGMFAVGGRGGDVCHVTSLRDSGDGTLRDCLTEGSGPRTVVFDTGGIIDLTATLTAQRDNLTIAGQTAPGDGITVRGHHVDLRGDDLIIQHVRFRAGDIRKATASRDGFTEDSLTVTGTNIIVDHVSASWGIDECLSAGRQIDNLTIQYTIIAEGLHRTRLFHGEYDPDHPGHSMGSLLKPRGSDGEMTLHHNLFAHNNNRNPAIGSYEGTEQIRADIRNNVVYDCPSTGYTSGASERTEVNYIGNYLIFGPDSRRDFLFEGNRDNNVRLYQRDNRRDTDSDRTLDGADVGWANFDGDFDQQDAPFSFRPVTTHSATEAVTLVLDQAGARPWNRDSVDRRIVQSVLDRSGGRIDSQEDVGGWGTVSSGTPVTDGDRDGMPDDWERENGTDPDRPDNNGDLDRDGYSNLENYLHWTGRLVR